VALSRRGVILAIALPTGAFLAGLAVWRQVRPEPPPHRPENALAVLDESRWARTSEGDFEEAVVDGAGERLRLRAATRGTQDGTVKFLGVRSVRPFPVGIDSRIRARLDWNKQSNGSYLSGAIIVCPGKTAANPLSEEDWVKVEIVGVPPGQTARLQVVCRTKGREQYLYTEGWPEANRAGRSISLEEIEIRIDRGTVTVLEQRAVVFETKEKVVAFESAYLYLQLSTHSNYPAREIYFEGIAFPQGP